jgi:predicted transcriptional regulator
MLKLSKAQLRALRLAAKYGIVDTLSIGGNTGKSLYKKGLFIRHDSGDDVSTFSYELTDKGLALAKEHGFHLEKVRE